MAIKKACVQCGQAFVPQHARHRKCSTCSPNSTWPTPSPSSVAARQSKYQRNRLLVLKRDKHERCAICGKPGPLDEVDHIVPVARGGTHDMSNLRATHSSCNRSRKAGPA